MIGVALACSVTAGAVCAKRPPQNMPAPVIEEGAAYAAASYSAAEAAPNHMTRPLSTDNSVIYEQNFGGGGVATGVLFGPFGVAANIASIKHRTVQEAAELNGKIAISPLELLQRAAAEAGLTLATQAADKAVILKPSLSVASIDGEQLGFAVTLIVDQRPAGRDWTGQYIYQLRPQFARTAVAAGLPQQDLDALSHEAATAMVEVLRLYLADGRGELKGTQRIKFKSPFISRRFTFMLEGEEIATQTDRLLVRFPLSIYSLRRDAVSFSN